MRVFFQSLAVVVLALSLVAPLTWAGTASNVASLVENPDSYQSQVVRVTGTVYNHRIRRGVNKCYQLFTLEDETGSIDAVYKVNCSGARNSLRDRDVVTVEAQFERTSGDSGMLKVRSILSKVAPSAQ
jgi:cytochrome c-type biogenesis protein CcmE